MINFLCGVTAKPSVSRLHRLKKWRVVLNITEIWQLRRRKKPTRKLLIYYVLTYSNKLLRKFVLIKKGNATPSHYNAFLFDCRCRHK
jgi:hypothetical protein